MSLYYEVINTRRRQRRIDHDQNQYNFNSNYYEYVRSHVAPASNLLSNVWNQSREAVLAEPFPWTVTQGVILVLVIINSQL